jgi:peptidoglycan hydrolase-like protein with peptidoglycan-binding domain
VTSNLKFGSRGEEVKILQQALVKEKLLAPNLTTGYYGTLTQSAVQKLQTKYNVISSGNPQTTGYGSVGPKTKDIINTILKK